MVRQEKISARNLTQLSRFIGAAVLIACIVGTGFFFGLGMIRSNKHIEDIKQRILTEAANYPLPAINQPQRITARLLDPYPVAEAGSQVHYQAEIQNISSNPVWLLGTDLIPGFDVPDDPENFYTEDSGTVMEPHGLDNFPQTLQPGEKWSGELVTLTIHGDAPSGGYTLIASITGADHKLGISERTPQLQLARMLFGVIVEPSK